MPRLINGESTGVELTNTEILTNFGLMHNLRFDNWPPSLLFFTPEEWFWNSGQVDGNGPGYPGPKPGQASLARTIPKATKASAVSLPGGRLRFNGIFQGTLGNIYRKHEKGRVVEISSFLLLAGLILHLTNSGTVSNHVHVIS